MSGQNPQQQFNNIAQPIINQQQQVNIQPNNNNPNLVQQNKMLPVPPFAAQSNKSSQEQQFQQQQLPSYQVQKMNSNPNQPNPNQPVFNENNNQNPNQIGINQQQQQQYFQQQLQFQQYSQQQPYQQQYNQYEQDQNKQMLQQQYQQLNQGNFGAMPQQQQQNQFRGGQQMNNNVDKIIQNSGESINSILFSNKSAQSDQSKYGIQSTMQNHQMYQPINYNNNINNQPNLVQPQNIQNMGQQVQQQQQQQQQYLNSNQLINNNSNNQVQGQQGQSYQSFEQQQQYSQPQQQLNQQQQQFYQQQQQNNQDQQNNYYNYQIQNYQPQQFQQFQQNTNNQQQQQQQMYTDSFLQKVNSQQKQLNSLQQQQNYNIPFQPQQNLSDEQNQQNYQIKLQQYYQQQYEQQSIQNQQNQQQQPPQQQIQQIDIKKETFKITRGENNNHNDNPKQTNQNTNQQQQQQQQQLKQPIQTLYQNFKIPNQKLEYPFLDSQKQTELLYKLIQKSIFFRSLQKNKTKYSFENVIQQLKQIDQLQLSQELLEKQKVLILESNQLVSPNISSDNKPLIKKAIIGNINPEIQNIQPANKNIQPTTQNKLSLPSNTNPQVNSIPQNQPQTKNNNNMKEQNDYEEEEEEKKVDGNNIYELEDQGCTLQQLKLQLNKMSKSKEYSRRPLSKRKIQLSIKIMIRLQQDYKQNKNNKDSLDYLLYLLNKSLLKKSIKQITEEHKKDYPENYISSLKSLIPILLFIQQNSDNIVMTDIIEIITEQFNDIKNKSPQSDLESTMESILELTEQNFINHALKISVCEESQLVSEFQKTQEYQKNQSQSKFQKDKANKQNEQKKTAHFEKQVRNQPEQKNEQKNNTQDKKQQKNIENNSNNIDRPNSNMMMQNNQEIIPRNPFMNIFQQNQNQNQNSNSVQSIMTKPLPTFQEIQQNNLNYDQFLMQIPKQGKFNNLSQYLTANYYLTREDVRKHFNEIISYGRIDQNRFSQEFRSNFYVYCNIRVVNIKFDYEAFHVELKGTPIFIDRSKIASFQNSKRLMHGSLIFICNTDIDNPLIGTVSYMDPNIDTTFQSQQTVKFSIQIKNNKKLSNSEYFQEIIDFLRSSQNKQYYAFEPRNFWTACSTCLKEIRKMSKKQDLQIPFQNIIVDGQTQLFKPQFKNHKTIYKFKVSSGQNTEEKMVSFDITQQWPSHAKGSLDDTQFQALQNMLTKQISLIQGPPGTGKTHVGITAVKTLLMNWDNWNDINNPSPILIICKTNHALDQFLLHISKFTNKIVRLGKRCNVPELEKFLISKKNKGLKPHPEQTLAKEAMSSSFEDVIIPIDRVHKIPGFLEHYNKINFNIMEFVCEQFLADLQMDGVSLSEKEKVLIFDRWWRNKFDEGIISELAVTNREFMKIDNEKQSIKREMLKTFYENRQQAEKEYFLNRKKNKLSNKIDVNALEISLSYQSQGKKDSEIEEDLINDENIELQEIQEKLEYQNYDFNQQAFNNFIKYKQNQNGLYIDYTDYMNLKIYGYMKQHEKSFQMNLNTFDKYKKECKKWIDRKSEYYLEILKENQIAGMTLTGAQLNMHTLNKLNYQIIILEEAGQIQESQMIPLFRNQLKQIIMIGDHKQLKPSTFNYVIGEQYNLNQSLLERLILNKVQFVELGTQRRMRKEFSNITRLFYPALTDHSSVSLYPNVKGMQSNFLFITHDQEEVKAL